MSDSDEELAEVERQMTVLRAAKQTALQKAPPKPKVLHAEDEPWSETSVAPAGISKYLAETSRKDIASAQEKARISSKNGRVPIAGDSDEDAMWADLLQGLSLGKFASTSPFRRSCARVIFSECVLIFSFQSSRLTPGPYTDLSSPSPQTVRSCAVNHHFHQLAYPAQHSPRGHRHPA
jgi:hypothetical protein